MPVLSRAQRRQAGQALREQTPRGAHARWLAAADRDPIQVLTQCQPGRLPELAPLRYGRMLKSPFTFLRGSPGLMAHDLAGTPTTQVRVQACGDCHLLNFGLFASPERNLLFDINDFDETLPGPWEWDLKRLVTSFVVAARENGLAESAAHEAAQACGRAYRRQIREYAEQSPLEIWYSRIDARDLIRLATDADDERQRKDLAKQARTRIAERMLPKITEIEDGRHRFLDQPPVMRRLTDPAVWKGVRAGLEQYRSSLADDRRSMFDRYELEDFALRVVGIGSVGTRCFVALFYCDDQSPLLLQIKEARHSVLEPSLGPGAYAHQGQRVVIGQRLMQAASDIFLGWASGGGGRDYYVRQLRDMKLSLPVERMRGGELGQYAEVCGWTLARAHAKSGDAAVIAGYLGGSDKADDAFAEFARAYADQIEADHARLTQAVRAGHVAAEIE